MTALFWKSTLVYFSLMVLPACGYLDMKDSSTNSVIRFSEEHLNQLYDCFCKELLTCTAVYNYTKGNWKAKHTQDFYKVTAIKHRTKPSHRKKSDSFFNMCQNYHTPRKSGQIKCEKDILTCQTLQESSLFHFKQTCTLSCEVNGKVFSKKSDPLQLNRPFITCTPNCAGFPNLTQVPMTPPVLKPVQQTEAPFAVVVDKTAAPTGDAISSTNETGETKNDKKIWVLLGAILAMVIIGVLITGIVVFFWRNSKQGLMSPKNGLISESSSYGGANIIGKGK